MRCPQSSVNSRTAHGRQRPLSLTLLPNRLRSQPICAIRRRLVVPHAPKGMPAETVNWTALDGAAVSRCTRLPLSFFFLLFLRFLAMSLDGEEQSRADDGQLECDEDDRNPIHDFLDTLPQQPRQWFKLKLDAAWEAMTFLVLVAMSVPRPSPKSKTQNRPKNSGSDERYGGFARKTLVKVQW